MKAILHKLLFLVLLLPAAGIANDFNGRHTKEKKVKKEFSVPQDGILAIENSYGSIDISTWDDNRVMIQVIIKTNGDDAERVQNKLDEITVAFQQKGNRVSAKTHYQKEDRSWWNNLFGSNNGINMEINYIIKAPINNHLTIDNSYGAIYIDKTNGNTHISCNYGKIDIGDLKGKKNILNFDYTRNSHFGYITSAEINADYSEFTVDEAEDLVVKADYTDSKIKKVTRLKFNCDYGSFSVDKVKDLEADGDYLSTKIGRVFSSLHLNQDYGSLSIEKLIEGVKTVNINTDYVGIKLGFDAAMDFQFNVRTSYGKINGTDNLQVLKNHDRNTSQEISGYYSNSSSVNSIHISTSYGSVSFDKVP